MTLVGHVPHSRSALPVPANLREMPGGVEARVLRRIRLALAALGNREIAFGGEFFAAAPPSARRPPCIPAFPAVARGALAALRRIPAPPAIPLSA